MPSLLFLSLMNGASWGGSEELWFRAALHAAAKGYQVGCAFYQWAEKEEKVEALRQAGCRLYLLPNKGRRKQNLYMRLQYIQSKRQARRKVAALPFKEYDLTVINLGGFEIYTEGWKDLYRRIPKYALLFHNYNEDAAFKPRQANRLRHWLQASAANLFAAGRIWQVLEEKLNMVISQAAVFINPITLAPPAQAGAYPALEPPFIFAMLAELDASRKAQDNLVRALASTKWKARPWKLWLYGKGNDREKLQSLINELAVGDKVELKGHSQNVSAVLQAAHLVLQITHRDAMPLAVMEAMAMARPLVISRVGDMPEWVKEGENGWIAENASITEIDSAMERAWQQKEAWPLAGKRSFEIFSQKFPSLPEERFLQQLETAIKSA